MVKKQKTGHVHRKQKQTRLCSLWAQAFAKASDLNQRWSGIWIHISGLIRIRIWISAWSLPECCGFISLSASVISSCHENRPVTVWGTLINLLKSPIPQWWWKWKSDPESAPRTESPPKVNKLFRLVEPIITASVCTQSDCQTNSNTIA